MTDADINQCSLALYQAMRERRVIPPLTETMPHISVADAYKISVGFLGLRIKDGEKLIGKKIGATSRPVQAMLNVHEPDFGFLTDAMQVDNDGQVEISRSLIQPRAEAEIAFIMAKDLRGPGITAEHVAAATEAIVPCFEIVDSRIRDWKIRIQDTVADNASCGVFTLGNNRISPRGIDLASLQVRVTKNGSFLSAGMGSAVQGSPLNSVAWLANTLGNFGVALEAGDVVLSGSLVPLEPAKPGDTFSMILSEVGSASIRFC